VSRSERCGTCRYFESYVFNRGRCRRYPPVPRRSWPQDDAVFPATFATQWCGEYTPKHGMALVPIVYDNRCSVTCHCGERFEGTPEETREQLDKHLSRYGAP
jgi:hypothetical protein